MRKYLMTKLLTSTLLGLSLFACNASASIYNYVGSFNVSQGPAWQSNPDVYSAVEAAALIFGGNASDYAVSINSDTVTHTAWYDGWGDHTGRVFADTFKLDLGLPGYNAIDSVGDFGRVADNGGYGDGTAAAYSAYVLDGISDVNYVWRASPVPVPAAVWLFGSALLGLVGVSRRNKI
jgi:hypothetical protein